MAVVPRDHTCLPLEDTQGLKARPVGKGKKQSQKPHNLTILQNVTKTMFAEASAEVREEAKQFRIQWNKVIDEGRDPLEDDKAESDKEEGDCEE